MSFLISLILSWNLGMQQASDWEGALIHSPRYRYPYNGLERSLKARGIKSLTIFGYGSLVDRRSASKSLSNRSLKTGEPAAAFGLKRIFNRDIPVDPTAAWGVPCDPKARAMLNVFKTGNPDDVVTGVIYEVALEDLASLRKREPGYDLVPILYVDWSDYIGNQKLHYRIAYVFHSPKESRYTSDDILPRPGYYELTRDAAKKHGPEFYRLWMESTYLSDETTPIVEWENAVKSKEFKSLKYHSLSPVTP